MVILCGGMAVSGLAKAASKDSVVQSYMGIVERNAFGLKDLPPLVTELKPQSKLNVVLTGIANIGGSKKAFFRIPGKDANSFQYLELKEGEQENQVKVLAGGIDESGGRVKILDAGIPVTLDFEKNGNQQAVSSLMPGGIGGRC